MAVVTAGTTTIRVAMKECMEDTVSLVIANTSCCSRFKKLTRALLLFKGGYGGMYGGGMYGGDYYYPGGYDGMYGGHGECCHCKILSLRLPLFMKLTKLCFFSTGGMYGGGMYGMNGGMYGGDYYYPGGHEGMYGGHGECCDCKNFVVVLASVHETYPSSVSSTQEACMVVECTEEACTAVVSAKGLATWNYEDCCVSYL